MTAPKRGNIASPPRWLRRFTASLSTPGLLAGTLLFAASLSPSLLPRGVLLQGIVSGLSLAAGYGVGVGWRWVWGYLELPLPDRRVQRVALWVAAVLCVGTALAFLWQASEWQNAVRDLMELEPVDTARPFTVGAIAAGIFTLLLGVARLFHFTFRELSERLGQRMPHRVANVIGLVLAGAIFWSAADGVLFEFALRSADTSFQRLDARREADAERPTDPRRTGSAASLITWGELGRTGRAHVSSAPTADELEGFFGERMPEPIRVYVGLNAAESPEARARLALDELLRVRAFERSVLAVVTPTGTGWIDPGAITPLEYLHRGDLASVAVQYSYLPSWLSLIAEADYGAETAAALFQEVYEHWSALSPDTRPRLVLHGLSLGALNSEQSADLWDVIADPFHGALWAGPPSRSPTWSELTEQRDPDSPPWLPVFRDGSVVRFMNQNGTWADPEAPWGPMRIVYLQYASDPVAFFEPEAFFRAPEWLDEPRGPDVSERLRWFPIVTALQLIADVAAGYAAPVGYGHVYAPEDYIDAWLEVADPPGWSPPEIARLKEHLSDLKSPPEEEP